LKTAEDEAAQHEKRSDEEADGADNRQEERFITELFFL
jgi:hypothetical protein